MADNQSLLQGAVAMSTISVALLIIFLVALLNPELADRIRGRVAATAGEAGSSPTVKILVGALGAFAPDMAILSGFVSDIVNIQFRHSVLSFSAIIAVIINRLIFGTGALRAAGEAAGAAAAAATGAPQPRTGFEVANAPAAPAAPAPVTAQVAEQVAQTVAPGIAPSVVIGHSGRLSSRGAAAAPGTVFTATGEAGLGPPAVGGSRKQKAGAIPREIADNYNPCAIRGLAFLDTERSPMGMVALMTIFTTVFWDMWINNKRTTAEILGTGAFGLVVLIMNVASYTVFGCYGRNAQERLLNTFKAFVWGAIVGSVAFLIFQYAPDGSQYLPIDPSPASLSQPSSGRTPLGPGGQQGCPPGQISVNGQCTPAPSESAKCTAPNDGDQFVCDAYKNGKLVSTTFSS